MKTKEKARELVNKFDEINLNANGNMTDSNGKKCALLCVDEIIKGIDNLQYNRKTDYWENVKKEIEKL